MSVFRVGLAEFSPAHLRSRARSAEHSDIASSFLSDKLSLSPYLSLPLSQLYTQSMHYRRKQRKPLNVRKVVKDGADEVYEERSEPMKTEIEKPITADEPDPLLGKLYASL